MGAATVGTVQRIHAPHPAHHVRDHLLPLERTVATSRSVAGGV